LYFSLASLIAVYTVESYTPYVTFICITTYLRVLQRYTLAFCTNEDFISSESFNMAIEGLQTAEFDKKNNHRLYRLTLT